MKVMSQDLFPRKNVSELSLVGRRVMVASVWTRANNAVSISIWNVVESQVRHPIVEELKVKLEIQNEMGT